VDGPVDPVRLGLYGSNLVRYTAGTVADALDSGGIGALQKINNRMDPEGNMRLFVFDQKWE
jgi:hypothetical protein